MRTYAAIDLHSNNGVLAIIDETDRVLRQRKLPNKLELLRERARTVPRDAAGRRGRVDLQLVLARRRTPRARASQRSWSTRPRSSNTKASSTTDDPVRRLVAGAHDAAGDPARRVTSIPRDERRRARPAPEAWDARAAADREHPERAEPRAEEPGNENHSGMRSRRLTAASRSTSCTPIADLALAVDGDPCGHRQRSTAQIERARAAPSQARRSSVPSSSCCCTRLGNRPDPRPHDHVRGRRR